MENQNAGIGVALLWFFIVAMVVAMGLGIGGAIAKKLA